MARTISHSFAALTCKKLFLSLEHKIHIFSPPCNILYISCHIFRLNTQKCTSKAPAVDLWRQSTLGGTKTSFYPIKDTTGPPVILIWESYRGGGTHCRILRSLFRVLGNASRLFIHFSFHTFYPHEEPVSRLFVCIRFLLVCGER